MKKMNKSLKNMEANKGFTLVELIIVIAIIAVLAAVLAPQYIQYVERSRISTDRNCVTEIAHAMEVAAVGDGTTTPTGNVTITTQGNLAYTTDNTMTTAIKAVVPAASYKFVSKAYTAAGVSVTFTYNATTGSVSTTGVPAGDAAGNLS